MRNKNMKTSFEYLLPYNKFFKVTYTNNNISTYLIHRVDISLELLIKYNTNLLNNYVERVGKEKFNFKNELKLVNEEVKSWYEKVNKPYED